MGWRQGNATVYGNDSCRGPEVTAGTPRGAALAGVIRCALVAATVTSFLLTLPAVAADSSEAANIFKKRCSACHTFGKGAKVGPDLKGVNERRKRDWLLKFVRSSQTTIQSGDPIAATLFQQFQRQRMPDWTDLSPETIGAILDYFAVNGPEQKEPDEYPAESATETQIEAGRKLFYGETSLHYGGQSCNGCHRVGSRYWAGGSLGPDLTHAYDKYRDTTLTLFLKRPCFERVPETYTGDYLPRPNPLR